MAQREIALKRIRYLAMLQGKATTIQRVYWGMKVMGWLGLGLGLGPCCR